MTTRFHSSLSHKSFPRKILIATWILLSLLAAMRAQAQTCESLFTQRLTSDEVYAAQAWMAQRFSEYPSKFSMRYKRAIARTGDPQNVGTEALSFGSGPDIFTPLINFPLAQRIHLVDSWKGWGQGTGHVLHELVMRLRAVHPEIRLAIKNEGFLASLPADVSGLIRKTVAREETERDATSEALTYKLEKFEADKPLVIEASWNQEGLGPVSREVLIHAMNYFEARDLAHLDRKLDQGTLGGILIEGAPYPPALANYTARLAPHGLAVLEAYSDYTDMNGFLRDLRKTPGFRVRLVHMETYQRYGNPKPIEQRLYLVRRSLAK